MKTLVIKTNSEAYLEASEANPAVLAKTEESVYSFRVNLDKVHGRALKNCSEAVEYVLGAVYTDFMAGLYLDNPKADLKDYVVDTLAEYRKEVSEPQIVRLSQQKRIIKLANSMYFVLKDKAEFEDLKEFIKYE